MATEASEISMTGMTVVRVAEMNVPRNSQFAVHGSCRNGEKNNISQAPSADGLQFFTPGRDVVIELGVKCTKIKTQTVVLIGVVYFHIIYRCFMIVYQLIALYGFVVLYSVQFIYYILNKHIVFVLFCQSTHTVVGFAALTCRQDRLHRTGTRGRLVTIGIVLQWIHEKTWWISLIIVHILILNSSKFYWITY